MPHTPGPWRISKDGDFLEAPNGDPIADLRYLHLPNNEANARLIAAAPELLEALTDTIPRFVKCMEASGTDTEFAEIAVAKYRAAIARATAPDPPPNPPSG